MNNENSISGSEDGDKNDVGPQFGIDIYKYKYKYKYKYTNTNKKTQIQIQRRTHKYKYKYRGGSEVKF